MYACICVHTYVYIYIYVCVCVHRRAYAFALFDINPYQACVCARGDIMAHVTCSSFGARSDFLRVR